MSTGSCLCSGVKYSLTGTSASQAFCHYTTCHKISGAGSLSITTGSTLLKDFSILHESGAMFTVHFCSKFGTTVYKTGDGKFEGKAIVQAGTVDVGLDGVQVGAELWAKQCAGWVTGLEGVVQLEGCS